MGCPLRVVNCHIQRGITQISDDWCLDICDLVVGVPAPVDSIDGIQLERDVIREEPIMAGRDFGLEVCYFNIYSGFFSDYF